MSWLEDFKKKTTDSKAFTPPVYHADTGSGGKNESLYHKVTTGLNDALIKNFDTRIGFFDASTDQMTPEQRYEYEHATPLSKAIVDPAYDFVAKGVKAVLPDAAEQYARSIKRGFASGYAGVVGGISDFVGDAPGGNYMNEVAQNNARDREYSGGDYLSLDYLTNPSGLAYDLSNVAGSSVPLGAFAALVPEGIGAGAAAGVGGEVATGALGKIGQVGGELLGKYYGKSLPSMFAKGVVRAIPEAMSEGGNTMRDMLNNGYSLDEAQSAGRKTAMENALLLAGTNTLEGALMGGKIFNPAPKAGEGLFARLAKAPLRATPILGANALQNGFEEFAQQGIQNMNEGNDYSFNPFNAPQDQLDAGIVGAISGGLMAGVPGVARAAFNKPKQEEAHTYNLPMQSGIEEQVNNLKPEFREALPTIGGILDELGVAKGAEISSGYRSPEHNKEVGGAPNSYHTHGDAVDIVLPEGTTKEQAEKVLNKFKATGAFKEVLFHDAGSGYHLHLGGYNGSLHSSQAMANNEAGEAEANPEATNLEANSEGEDHSEPINTFTEAPTVGDEASNIKLEDNKAEENKQEPEPQPVANNTNTATEDKQAPAVAPQRPNMDFSHNANQEINLIKKFAAITASKTSNPQEAHALRSLFNNYANVGDYEHNDFIDPNKAVDYIVENYGNKPEFQKFMEYQAKKLGLDQGIKPNGDSATQPLNQGQNVPQNVTLNGTQNNQATTTTSPSATANGLHNGTHNQNVIHLKNKDDYDKHTSPIIGSFLEGIGKINKNGDVEFSWGGDNYKLSGEAAKLWKENNLVDITKDNPVESPSNSTGTETKKVDNHDEEKRTKKTNVPLVLDARVDSSIKDAVRDRYKNGETYTEIIDNLTNLIGEEKVSMYKDSIDSAYDDAKKEAMANAKKSKIIKFGKEDEIITDDNEHIKFRYALMPVKEVIASNNPDFSVNKNYPKEYQPRDRERVAMRQQVVNMAAHLEPIKVIEGYTVNNGAPIVTDKGVVLNGNGRVLAIRMAYDPNTPATSRNKYRDYLKAHLGDYGLTMDDFDHVSNAVLVRVVDHPTQEQVKEIINATDGGAEVGSLELAQKDAKKINSQSLAKYIPNEKGTITGQNNKEFIGAVIHDISTDNEINSMLTKDGDVNIDGVERVKRAVFALAYKDEGLVRELSEDGVESLKNIMNAYLRLAPAVGKLRLDIQNGEIDSQYNFPDVMSRGLWRYKKIKEDKNETVYNYLNTSELFSADADSDEVKAWVKFLDENKITTKKIDEVTNQVIKSIKEVGNANQISLLGEKPTLKSIMDSAIAKANGENQGNLFADNETTKAEPEPEQAPKTEAKPKETKKEDKKHTKLKGEDKAVKEMLKHFKDKELYQRMAQNLKYDEFREYFDEAASDYITTQFQTKNSFFDKLSEYSSKLKDKKDEKEIVAFFKDKVANDLYNEFHSDKNTDERNLVGVFRYELGIPSKALWDLRFDKEMRGATLKKIMDDLDVAKAQKLIKFFFKVDVDNFKAKQSIRKILEAFADTGKLENVFDNEDNKAQEQDPTKGEEFDKLVKHFAEDKKIQAYANNEIKTFTALFKRAFEDYGVERFNANDEYFIKLFTQEKLFDKVFNKVVEEVYPQARKAYEAKAKDKKAKAQQSQDPTANEEFKKLLKHFVNNERIQAIAADTDKKLFESIFKKDFETLGVDRVNAGDEYFTNLFKQEGLFDKVLNKLTDEVYSQAKEAYKAQAKAEPKSEDNKIFGDKDEAEANFFATLGIKPVEAEEEKVINKKLMNVVDDSEDALKEAIGDLVDEVNKSSANPMFNPVLIGKALKVGLIYLQRGVNKYPEWHKTMVDAIGDKIKIWCPAIWEAMNSYPADMKFDDNKVAAAMQYVGSIYESGVKDLNKIQATFAAKAGKENAKAFAPLIECAYNGVKEFYASTAKEEANNGYGDVSNDQAGNSNAKAVSSDLQTEDVQGAEKEGEPRPANSGLHGQDERQVHGDNPELLQGVLPGASEDGLSRRSAGNESGGSTSKGTSGGGSVSEGTTTQRSEAEVIKAAKTSSPALTNYHATSEDKAKSPATRIKNNIAAIKLVKELEAEGRRATPEEQETLAQYTGWGGLSTAFSDGKTRAELEELLTKEEMDRAQSSILSAYYTSPTVVKSIWKLAEHLGFDGGRILEPSMGIGNFFAYMPQELMAKSKLTGYELDHITGAIAQQLYQEARVNIQGFETGTNPDGYFDLAIGNVPFGDFTVNDPKYNSKKYKIHNYFIQKALDKVRPGGLVMLISSTRSMDGQGNAKVMRREVGNQADFIGAIRLPDTAFTHTGTKVNSDIIILRKRGGGKTVSGADWMTSKTNYYAKFPGHEYNGYYHDHEEMMIGNLEKITNQYGKNVLNLNGKNINLEKAIAKATENIPGDIYKPIERKLDPRPVATMQALNEKLKSVTRVGTFVVGESGGIYSYNGSEFEKLKLAKKYEPMVAHYIKLRDITKKLISSQLDPKATDKQLDTLRQELNKLYDQFVKKYGYLNDSKISKQFMLDPDSGTVLALEKYDLDKKTKKATATKNPIFTSRTMGAIKEVEKVDNAFDGLANSLSSRGYVDVDYIAKLMDTTPEDVVQSLGDTIYKNPNSEQYEHRDEYLAGNVKMKLAEAIEAAKTDPSYKKNVDALRKIQPVDLAPEDIVIKLGAGWIPASDIENFARYILEDEKKVQDGDIRYLPNSAQWVINKGVMSYGGKATVEWGTDDIPFRDILELALNHKSKVIYRTIDRTQVKDEEATARVDSLIDRVKKEFESWVYKDDERKARLTNYYNDHFNTEVLRNYDGSHLTLPGFNLVGPQLNPHQKNAVWRIMQPGNTLLAHCVGAGKTWTMQAAAMEMRRLGIARKPMFVIPNHMLKQFEKEWLQIYPGAQLLTLQSSDIPELEGSTKRQTTPEKAAEKKAKRQKTLARIQTEDWDGIIISHNMFKRIPMGEKNKAQYIQEELDLINKSIIATHDGNINGRVISQLERGRIKLETELQKSLELDGTDLGIPFEELGVDALFVDEADLFKNLGYVTQYNRISGLSQSNSQRSVDMYFKTRYLTEQTKGKVVFATGTPISNTIAEMYTMLRYMDTQRLKDLGLDLFDNWANQYCNIEPAVERSADTGGYKIVNKVTSFINFPELAKLFRKYADIKRPEDLNLPRPQLKGGKANIVQIEPSEALNHFIKEEVKSRAEAIHKHLVDADEDNMLKLTGELRRGSLDMRILDDSLGKEVGTKLEACADMILKEYNDSNDRNGAQLVFCDLSTPKGISDKEEPDIIDDDNEDNDEELKTNFNVYAELKRLLIKRGIPEKEISYIHEAKTAVQKQNLFDDVNEGRVRVLLGSTEKMGAGTNCQRKLVSLHHLDCPWRPRDLEQREGRILRRGNENKEVSIYNYVTKGSFDANMWEKVKNKQTLINQALNADINARTIEDVDATVISFAEAEALASGNPLMAEKTLVDADVRKYEIRESSWMERVKAAEQQLAIIPSAIEEAKSIIAKNKEDVKTRVNLKGDNFKITLKDTIITSRDEAKKALEVILDQVLQSKDARRVIGKIGNMDIVAKFNNTTPYKVVNGDKVTLQEGAVSLTLVNNRAYEVNTNSIGGIEHVYNNAPEASIEKQEDRISKMEGDVASLKAVANSQFEDADKLHQLLKRQKELAQAMQELANKEKQKDGAEPSTTTEEENNETSKTSDSPSSEEKENASTTAEDKPVKLSKRLEDLANEFQVDPKLLEPFQGTDNNITADNINENNRMENLLNGIKNSVARARLLELTGENYETYQLSNKLEEYLRNYLLNTKDGFVIKKLKDEQGKDYESLEIDGIQIATSSHHDIYFDVDPTKDFPELPKTDPVAKVLPTPENLKQADKATPKEEAKEKSSSATSVEKFIHTKTKEELQKVKLIAELEREDYKAVNAIAKSMGTSYSRFAKGWLFSTPEEAEEFRAKVDAKLTSLGVKFSFDASAKYKGKTNEEILREVKPIHIGRLNSQQQEIMKLGKTLGVPIVWIKAPSGIRGFYARGISFLNVNSNWPLNKVFWHEAMHNMLANNPSMYNEFVQAMGDTISPEQIEDYRKTIHNGDKLSTDEVVEEMLADNMEDVMKRVKLLQGLSSQKPSLIKRVVEFLHDLLQNFTNYLNNKDGRLTNSQRDTMIKAFTNLAGSLKDGQGNKLFTVNKGLIQFANKKFMSISDEELKRWHQDEAQSLENIFGDDKIKARFSADDSVDSLEGTYEKAQDKLSKLAEDVGLKQKEDSRVEILRKVSNKVIMFFGQLRSPFRLAEKYPVMKPLVIMADRAMRTQQKLRYKFGNELGDAYKGLSKNEVNDLHELMLEGDANAIEYGQGIANDEARAEAIVNETGVTEKVAKAYIAIRKLLDEAYHLVDETRRQTKLKHEIVDAKTLEQLKSNKFINIEYEQETLNEAGQPAYEVDYIEHKNWISQQVVTATELERLKNDDNVQILKIEEGHKDILHGQHYYDDKVINAKDDNLKIEDYKTYTVVMRETTPPLSKLQGYIPHFFHEYLVYKKNPETEEMEIIGSGRTENLAVEAGLNYLKEANDSTSKIIIKPKGFDFENNLGVNTADYAVTVGDMDYSKLVSSFAKEYEITRAEAENFIKDKVKKKGRHRFLGNTLYRSGAKGYETNMKWILPHYFNSISRYVALEKEFKPHAMNYYERTFGAWDKDVDGMARYAKSYISSINGNPTYWEQVISERIMKTPLLRNLAKRSPFGGRVALAWTNNALSAVAVGKLGMFNISSALLNYTQMLNTAAYLSGHDSVPKAVARLTKAYVQIVLGPNHYKGLTSDEVRCMQDSGVDSELGLESGAGYGKVVRGLADKTMFFFNVTEKQCRRACILAGYRQGREMGMTHVEAMDHAHSINRKSNFEYGVQDAPGIFRKFSGSIIGDLILQFQKYPIKEMEVVFDMLGKGTNMRQKMIFWGSFILLGGVWGIPCMDLFKELIAACINRDPENMVKECLFELAHTHNDPVTKALIKTICYGVLANAGIDISKRFGLGDVVPSTGPDYNKNMGWVGRTVSLLGGATGSTVVQMFSAYEDGDYTKMLRAFSPGLANMYTAASGASYDSRGRLAVEYKSNWDRLVHAAGFRTTKESITGDLTSIKYDNMDRESKERRKAIDDFLNAQENHEPLGPYTKRLKELGVSQRAMKKARDDRKKDRAGRLDNFKKKKQPDYFKGANDLD